MNLINGQTVVTITMKQLLGGLATLIVFGGGVLWAVLTFTIGGMRDDVRAISNSVSHLQDADKSGITRSHQIELRLSQQIAGLRNDITGLSGQLQTVNASVVSLSGQLNDVQKRIAARQAMAADPKYAAAFADNLKKLGVAADKIVVVPYGVAPIQ